MKFLTCRVSLQSNHANFQKKFSLTKNGGHFKFSNFTQKIAKHKNANISKTVIDGELSLKSIADSQFLSNNSFTYFWDGFHMVKFQTRR